MQSLKESNILILEDDQAIRQSLKIALETQGYKVSGFASTQGLLEKVVQKQFDLLILDVMLPLENGIDFCKKVRAHLPSIPIIFTSARIEQQHIIQGLKAGADDYLKKPFDLQELLVKIKHRLKVYKQLQSDNKENAQPSKIYLKNKVLIDLDKFVIVKNDQHIELSKKEKEILQVLLKHPGQVVSRQSILDQVWSSSTEITNRTIDNFILSIRKKIETNSSAPEHLISVRGVGYKFNIL